jgi:hypothetical protein
VEGRLVNGSDAQAISDASQLWSKLYSDSTPLAVVWPKTEAGVAQTVKCARAAGVKVVARWVPALCTLHRWCGISAADVLWCVLHAELLAVALRLHVAAPPAPAAQVWRRQLPGLLSSKRCHNHRPDSAQQRPGGTRQPHCHCAGGCMVVGSASNECLLARYQKT